MSGISSLLGSTFGSQSTSSGPALSSPGIGSGLDVQGIINKLMSIERQPLNALQSTQQSLKTRLSDYGKLSSALSTFQGAVDKLSSTSDFQLYQATSADTTAYTATADSTASTGSYNIQVQNLAAAQKMGSSNFSDAGTTTVGASGDQMKVTIGSNSFTVNIGGKTLNQIRDAINQASGNVGVTATVVQQNSSTYNLVLTSDNSGTANSMSLSFTNGSGSTITDPLGMSTIVSAADSSILVDNTYTITRSSNTITDALQGITLDLKATTTSNVKLNVSHDLTAVHKAAQSFVDAYNALHKTISGLQSGDLKSDSTLRMLQNQLYSVLNTPATGLSSSYKYLASVGVTIQKDGTMALDTTKLDSALNTDYSGVAKLFGDSGSGYMSRMSTQVGNMLDPANGLIQNSKDAVNRQLSDVGQQISDMQYRLSVIQDTYKKEFTGLDTLLGKMQTTSSYLTHQLG